MDPVAMAKFQTNDQQARIIEQLQSEVNGRRMATLIDILNGMGQVAQAAGAGDLNAKRLAEAFVQNLDALRAAAASKIVVPPGTKREPVEDDTKAEQERVAGS